MIASVPYTRAAIQLIRNGATVSDLGWSASMYASVCVTHGIARAKPEPPAAEKRCAENRKAIIIGFNPTSGEVTPAGIVVGLPKVQAALFAELYRLWNQDDESYVSSSKLCLIANHNGGRKSFGRLFERATARLTPIRIWIESKPATGYRLRVDP